MKIFNKFKKKTKECNNEVKSKSKTKNKYEEAKHLYENHTMNIAKSLHSWKLIAIISLCITFLSVCSIIYLSTRSSLIPYVIEVDETGNAKGINPANQVTYNPKESEIIYTVNKYIKNTRWIPLDPVLQNQFLLDALAHLDETMKAKLVKDIQEDNVKLSQQKKTRDIKITSTIKVAGTENTYQAKWDETLYDDKGFVENTKKYLGTFTLEIKTPKDIETLYSNPLGIIIKDYHITLEK